MEKKHKRKQYLIDPSFQIRFFLKFCLVVIVGSLVIGGVLFYLAGKSTTVAIQNTQVTVKTTADFLFPGLISTLLIVSFASSVVVLFITLMTSHKLSGPIFRLTREINLVKEGDLNRDFNIREYDQLQALALSLYEMEECLKAKHSELRENFQKLKEYLKDRDYSVTQEGKEELSLKIKQLEDKFQFFKC